MKRNANTHSKIYDLARKLKIYQPLAVGLMENLWHWTADEIPDGGIGKRTDETIAASIQWPWPKRSHELIEAMVDVGFLDEMVDCRLYVHDWHEHCEDSVHKKLARGGLLFANNHPPNLNRFSTQEKDRIIKEFYTDERTKAHGERTASAQKRTKAHGERTKAHCLGLSLGLSQESSPYPLNEEGKKTPEVSSQNSESGGNKPPGQSTAGMELPENSDRVKIWREAFKILSAETALARLTYEHVVNAARAFSDVDLVEEAKKMATKSRNFVNGIDEPGLWIWSWLQRCEPGAGGAVPPGPLFDPKKEMGAP